ncbi:Chloroperoxidase [Clohesyomyces aquaticus]|uniref:Chloroperoxidase n=1 Tax=Clohesyomyces aquaticus TaxID=1231657 RepID=A0A1Y1ZJ29_9PLEO|nr:Chloroperoxidase [Clohesyomyces aquaticus]
MKSINQLALVVLGLLSHGLARTVGFDPEAQYVENTGEHGFVPPRNGDYRGPCPGLNALANHGYIPHKGIASTDEIINASMKVFGMGRDLATLAALYGVAVSVSPDLAHMSIGESIRTGEIPCANGVSLKIKPQGLNFAHTSFEADASPTRYDKYQPESKGDANNLATPVFQQLLNRQANVPSEKINFDLNILADHRLQRNIDSVKQNPKFFLQPFGGFINGNTHAVIFQLFANRSAKFPEGRLDNDTLKSFYAVQQGPGGGLLKYYPGWEAIPDKWYRRPLDDPYTVPKLNADIVAQINRHPELLNKYLMGGNTYGVNTHRTIDIERLTNGTFKLEHMTDGYNLSCFSLYAGLQLTPRWVNSYYSDAENTVMKLLTTELPPFFADLKCPQLGAIDQRLLDIFPGWNAALPGPK